MGQAASQGTSGLISLDFAAAGHGWYVDPTPLTNTDDFLPTADPSVWKAKPGSAAEGKMDMLSVLLHEYGHALGLDHSADVRDFMGPALAAGERRLPTDAQLQLMAGLAASRNQAADTSPAPSAPWPPLQAWLGLPLLAGLRRKDAGGAAGLAGPQLQVAANAQLTNGNFGGAQAAGGNTSGWQEVGRVGAAQGGAVMFEAAGSQTQLNQIFRVGADDRFLTFTLAQAGLQANANGPQDAFEVALLSASSGLPALRAGGRSGVVDLSGSDALLNLQSNGTLRLAEGVRRVLNADGCSTYTVELPASLAGQDAFTYAVSDGQSGMATTTLTLTLTLTGTNDAAVISGDTTGAVQKDLTRSANGQLSELAVLLASLAVLNAPLGQ